MTFSLLQGLRVVELGESVSAPDCSERLIRVLSTTNFQLKGDCWEKDGYASKKPEPKE